MKLKDYIQKLQELEASHGEEEVYLTQHCKRNEDHFLDKSKVAKGPVLYGYSEVVLPSGNRILISESSEGRHWTGPVDFDLDGKAMNELMMKGAELPPEKLYIGLE